MNNEQTNLRARTADYVRLAEKATPGEWQACPESLDSEWWGVGVDIKETGQQICDCREEDSGILASAKKMASDCAEWQAICDRQAEQVRVLRSALLKITINDDYHGQLSPEERSQADKALAATEVKG